MRFFKQHHAIVLLLAVVIVGFTSAIIHKINLERGKDPYAVAIDEPIDYEDTETNGPTEYGDSVMVICAQDVIVNPVSKKAQLFYQNPNSSSNGVQLELYAEDQLIATSGILPPGYQLTQMDLCCSLEAAEGYYGGYLRIIFLDDDQEARAIDSKVDVRILVDNQN